VLSASLGPGWHGSGGNQPGAIQDPPAFYLDAKITLPSVLTVRYVQASARGRSNEGAQDVVVNIVTDASWKSMAGVIRHVHECIATALHMVRTRRRMCGGRVRRGGGVCSHPHPHPHPHPHSHSHPHCCTVGTHPCTWVNRGITGLSALAVGGSAGHNLGMMMRFGARFSDRFLPSNMHEFRTST
jgi:hypothetical protein